MRHPHKPQPKAAARHPLWTFVIAPLLSGLFTLVLLGAAGVLAFYLGGGAR